MTFECRAALRPQVKKKGATPKGGSVSSLFGWLALVVDQPLEVCLDEAGLVEGHQRAPVDALGQFVGGRLDLMGRELGHRVVKAPEAPGLVLTVAGVVPDDLDLVHVPVRDHLGLGEAVEDRVSLLVLDSAFREASEQLGAVLEAVHSVADNVHEPRDVQLVAVLLGEAELILKGLQAVAADQPQHAHLKRDAAGAVEGVVQDQAQAKVVAHLGHLDQLALEIVLDEHASAFAHDVGTPGVLAQLVVGERLLDSVGQALVLDQRVAFSADAQNALVVGPAVAHPAGFLALWGEQGNRLDSVVEAGGGGGVNGGCNGSFHGFLGFWFCCVRQNLADGWKVEESETGRKSFFEISLTFFRRGSRRRAKSQKF